MSLLAVAHGPSASASTGLGVLEYQRAGTWRLTTRLTFTYSLLAISEAPIASLLAGDPRPTRPRAIAHLARLQRRFDSSSGGKAPTVAHAELAARACIDRAIVHLDADRRTYRIIRPCATTRRSRRSSGCRPATIECHAVYTLDCVAVVQHRSK